MADCTECEFYEKYDGEELGKNSDKKAVMRCKFFRCYYSDIEIRKCTEFTPKQPAEKVEKSCETCRVSSYNNNGTSCVYHPDTPKGACSEENGFACWQPKQPAEEKECRTCKHSDKNNVCQTKDENGLFRSSTCCDGYSRWQPIPKPDKERIDKLIRDTITPNRKERKMSRIKKWIRRYVMGCTLYCTAIICIAVNPWVCKLWQMITQHDKNFWDACPSVTVVSWFFTACSIAAIIGVVIAFEKITAFAFGKLEK